MKATIKNGKKKGMFKGEGLIWLTLVFILLAIPVVNVYTKAILSESNIALQEVENKIKKQEDMNNSLKMEISELASLDKIQVVAQENGLTYKNDNIKVVTNE